MVRNTTTASQLSSLVSSSNKNTQIKSKDLKFDPTRERVVNLVNDKSHKITPAIYEIKNLVWNKNPDLHHSPASKEWINSIYSYNRNYIKSLPVISNIANKLLTSYFNLSRLVNGKKSNVNIVLEKRSTLNQIFVSKAEIKHTSDNINLTVHIYNRKKKTIFKRLSLLSKQLSRKYDPFKRKTNPYKVSSLFDNKREMTKLSNYYTINNPFAINLNNNKKIVINSVSSSNKETDTINSHKSYIYELKTLTDSHTQPIKDAGVCLMLGERKFKKANFKGKIKSADIRLSKLIKWGVRHLNKVRKLKAELLDIISSNSKSSKMLILDDTGEKILKSFNHSFTKYELKFFSKYLDKAYLKEMLYIYYIRALLFNNNLFKNWFLLGLKKSLSALYDKKVELNIVNQKYFHMNSDIFIKAIQTRLKNRNNRFLSEISFALRSVSLPKYMPRNVLKNDNLSFKPEIVNSSLKKDIFNSIKYKHIHGVRIEAAGRLTKRLTASRALFKIRNKGTLKNYDVTFNNKGALMLRAYIRPNLQYTNVSAKTRNGAFGLRGWVNSN